MRNHKSLAIASLFACLTPVTASHAVESGLLYLRALVGFTIQNPSFSIQQDVVQQPNIMGPKTQTTNTSGTTTVATTTPQIISTNTNEQSMNMSNGMAYGAELGYNLSPNWRFAVAFTYSSTRSSNNAYKPVDLANAQLGLGEYFSFAANPSNKAQTIMSPRSKIPTKDPKYNFDYKGGYTTTLNDKGEIEVKPDPNGNSSLMDLAPRIGTAKFTTFSAMANVYFDFISDGTISPYVLAGIGIGVTNAKGVGLDNPLLTPNATADSRALIDSKSTTAFMAQGGLGVAFEVSPNMILDLTYTFGNQAQAKYDMQVIQLGTLDSIAAVDTTAAQTRINQTMVITRKQKPSIQQTILVGLRMQF